MEIYKTHETVMHCVSKTLTGVMEHEGCEADAVQHSGRGKTGYATENNSRPSKRGDSQ